MVEVAQGVGWTMLEFRPQVLSLDPLFLDISHACAVDWKCPIDIAKQ